MISKEFKFCKSFTHHNEQFRKQPINWIQQLTWTMLKSNTSFIKSIMHRIIEIKEFSAGFLLPPSNSRLSPSVSFSINLHDPFTLSSRAPPFLHLNFNLTWRCSTKLFTRRRHHDIGLWFFPCKFQSRAETNGSS